jgi:hypothetical protein
VITARTDAAARPALQGSRQERWDKVASGAAEQCGRAVVPRVISAMTLEDLLRAPFEGRRITFRRPVGRWPGPRPSAVLAMVGPAGGFEDREAEQLARGGFELVASRILRRRGPSHPAVTLFQCSGATWPELYSRFMFLLRQTVGKYQIPRESLRRLWLLSRSHLDRQEVPSRTIARQGLRRPVARTAAAGWLSTIPTS